MAEIGTAFVTIVPSARGFGAKLNAETGPALVAGGKSGGKKFGGGLRSGAGSALKGFAGIFAAGVVVKGLKDVIGEAREAQKVGALTAQVIKSTGGAANVTASQVGKLATAISNKTGIDDEAIQKGSNLLLTFKNVRNEAGKGADVFNQATQAAVDLSAAGFGSIDSASKQLGKALNDPVKGMSALGRAGVTFTAGQQKQIKALVKSGDLLGAQKIILGEVKSQVGGAAAASSTAGEKMATAWNNAKESLGTALLPSIDKIENAITTKVIPAIVKFIGFLQKNPGIVKAFAIGIAAVAAAFVIAFIAANALIIGIGLLVAGAVIAFNKFPAFRAIVIAVFNGIKLAVVTAVKFIVGFIKIQIAIVKGIWAGIKAVVGFVKSAFSAVKNAITTAVTTVVKFVGDKVKAIITFFKDLPGKIIKGLGNLGKLLYNKGKDIMQGLIDGIKKIGSTIGKVLVGLLPGPLKKFAGKLGLASPSKLFAQYGKWTVEGYVQGIDRERRTVTPAMSRLANTAILPGNGLSSPRLSAVGPASTGPLVADIAGAEIAVGKDGLMQFVKGRIEIHDQQGAIRTRLG